MKKLSLLLLITVFGISMAPMALGAKEKVVMGLVHMGTTHPYHMAELNGAREAARRYNAELIIRTGEYDLEKQVAAAEDLITREDLDVITVLPLDQEAFRPTYKKIVERGIPLVVLQSYGKPEEAVTMVGFDEIGNSAKVGEYAVKLLEERYGEPRGEVAIIGGMLGQDAHNFRVQGFSEVMERYPNIKLVAVTPAEWDAKKATEVMENYIVAYPNLDVVYTLCDEMGVPAANVIRRARKSDQIFVVSLGGTQLDVIKNRRIEGALLLGLGPEHTGFTHQSVAYKVAIGEEIPEAVRVTGYMIDQTNIDNLLNLCAEIKADITKIPFENEEEVLKVYGIKQ